MKNKTYKCYKRLEKIDEDKPYHVKHYTRNILLTQENAILMNCIERIKNLYPLNDETKNNIYNMSAEEKMLIILEYDTNLQSIITNIIR